MNATTTHEQTSLYTQLLLDAQSEFRATVDRINSQMRNINRAERMARRLRDIELDASTQAGAGFVPYLVLRLPIDLLPLQRYVVTLAGNALERRLVANGRDSQGRDHFQILATGEERTSLELVVEGI
ncbi:hypothetical protein BI347_20665 [Chromobacterium sphagni]|uniref:Uncharacterized protein n=1 Tax=Chromobacterium sphagni TaxID=1903179 RepID=A0A1S1WSD6_9NEIS|nr:hypothetical protein [Chromobacterium sphagni]OHX10219.1 hypothetical protein BI347_20665 [Chromobacterium sphagni]